MFQFTYGQMCDEGFKRAVAKLAHHIGWSDYQALFECKKFIRQYEQTAKEAQKLLNEMIEKYAEKDEHGKVKPKSPEDPESFSIPEESQAAFKNERDVFDSTIVTFDVKPIPFKAFSSFPFSIIDCLRLDGVLQEPQKDEEQEQVG